MMSNFRTCIFLHSLIYCVALCGCGKRQDVAQVSVVHSTMALEKKLFEAIDKHDEATVKKLIVQGVDVNVHDEECGAYSRVIDFLLNGSAVDFAGGIVFEAVNGSPSLSAAECMNDNEEYSIKAKNILWALIEADASLDDCETLIRNIVESGDLPFVQLLLEKGIDFKKYKGVLYNAAVSGNPEVFKLILKFDNNIHHRSEYGRTILMAAVANETIVKTLLEMGVDVSIKDNQGRTAFISAVRNGNEAVVKLLLEHGADIHTRTNKGIGEFSGENALMQAALGGHTNIVTLLLKKGVGLEERDDNGATALHWAVGGVSRGWRNTANPNMTKFLLENGAQVNALDKYGQTPLHNTVILGIYVDVKTILNLVQFGADVSIKDINGKTPLDLFLQNDISDDLRAVKIPDILQHPRKAKYLAYAPEFDDLAEIPYGCRCGCNRMHDNVREWSLYKHGITLEKKISTIDADESIYYPKLSGFKDQAVQNKLNEKLASSFFKKWHIQKRAHAASTQKQYHSCDFDAWLIGNVIIIMKREFTIFDEAKVGKEKQTSFFIDARSGTFYHARDLFKQDAHVVEVISNIIQSSNQSKKHNFSDHKNVPLKNNFIITHEGIDVYLDTNNARHYGQRVFKIKHKDIDTIIEKNSDFYKSFNKAWQD